MIVEILQIFDTLTNGKIHLLYIFFILFVFLPSYVIKRNSKKYNISDKGQSMDVTVIVPIYTEDYHIFDRCLNSIRSQNPDQLIVSIDSKDQKLINIANKYNAEILKHDIRVGKRKALADAWLKTRNDIIIHVDSDIILQDSCLKEITKPFKDSGIAGISTDHICTYNGSTISYVLSSIIELSRNINDKALNGNLVVVDGKCSAWRKDFLFKVRDKFLDEHWMGTKCEIGDDRFLSREALKSGSKTIFNQNAKIYMPAPKSFNIFLKQQIRWRRSGTKFWIKDMIERVHPSKLYTYKCLTYYSAPIIFPLVIILDILFFRLSLLNFWEITIISIMIGTTLISIIRQTIYFGKIHFPRYVILQGILGLLILFPISVYGALTIKRQDIWMTRAYTNKL